MTIAISKTTILAEVRAECARLGAGRVNATSVATLQELERRIADLPDEAARRVTISMVQLRTGVFSTLPSVMRLYLESRGPILTVFQRSPMTTQAKVALGLKPTDLFAGLTSKEAHEALVFGCVDAYTYILRNVLAGSCDMTIVTRSLAVSRWVAACWADSERREALLLRRTGAATLQDAPMPDVEQFGPPRFIDRLDEIEECDLTKGVSTGVRAAFAASAARLARQNEQAIRERRLMSGEKLAGLIPSWWKPIRCARLLTTPEELSAEGREMHHCVGGYYSRVARGESVIVAVRVPDLKNQEVTAGTQSSYQRRMMAVKKGVPTWRRSTVEYSPEGRRVQHYGPSDKVPHPLCIKALGCCERRWGLSTNGNMHLVLEVAAEQRQRLAANAHRAARRET